ncbi:MAG: tryptophan-rich sensory protein [Eubacteriales bacterium]
MNNRIFFALKIILVSILTLFCLMLSESFAMDPTFYEGLKKTVFKVNSEVLLVARCMCMLSLAISFSIYLSSKDVSTLSDALLFFLLTLMLFPLYSYIFYQLESLNGALLTLGILFVSSVVLFERVFEKNKVCSYIILPTILWIGFCLFLNYELAFLN